MQPAAVRLILVDDHALFRESLARFLASEPDFEIVGECGTIEDALEIIKKSRANLVLLDLNLGTENGNDFISAARKAGYRDRFLIVSGAADAKSSTTALKLGASGIFLKSEPPSRLVHAIRMVASGAAWVDERIVQKLADRVINPDSEGAGARSGSLGEREQRVLDGVLDGVLSGLSNREIGGVLGIPEGTVKHIIQRLFKKARVRTRSQLVRAAIEGSFGAPQACHNLLGAKKTP